IAAAERNDAGEVHEFSGPLRKLMLHGGGAESLCDCHFRCSSTCNIGTPAAPRWQFASTRRQAAPLRVTERDEQPRERRFHGGPLPRVRELEDAALGDLLRQRDFVARDTQHPQAGARALTVATLPVGRGAHCGGLPFPARPDSVHGTLWRRNATASLVAFRA